MAVQRADTSTMEQSRWMADDYEVRITSATNGLDSGCGNGDGNGGNAGGAPELHMSVQARDEATEAFYRTRSDPVTSWLEQNSGGDPPVNLAKWRDALRRLGVEEHEDIAYIVSDDDLKSMGMTGAEISRFTEAQKQLEAQLEG